MYIGRIGDGRTSIGPPKHAFDQKLAGWSLSSRFRLDNFNA
jgi:hypothetical protein